MKKFLFGILCLLSIGFMNCDPEPGPGPQPELYNINLGSPENGAIRTSHTDAAEGTLVELTATPDEGYRFSRWTITGVTLSDSGANPVKFTMPASDVQVEALFSQITSALYSITPVDNENGTIESSHTEAPEGEELTFTVTPDDGYRVTSVEVNGEEIWDGDVTTVQEVEFAMPAENIEVSATFVGVEYAITVTPSSNGAVSVTSNGIDITKATAGTQIDITATANSGYDFLRWEITGVTLTDNTTANATFTMPANNVTIEAKFKEGTTPTFDPGVLFGNLKWATRNVNTPGTFVDSPEDDGLFYQWNRLSGWSATGPLESHDGKTQWDETLPGSDIWEAENDPCPEGWRIPSSEDVESLRAEGTVRYEVVGSNTVLTNIATEESIVIPRAGFRNYQGGSYSYGSMGYYWTSTKSTFYPNMGFIISFGSSGINVNSFDYISGGAVRCVQNNS